MFLSRGSRGESFPLSFPAFGGHQHSLTLAPFLLRNRMPSEQDCFNIHFGELWGEGLCKAGQLTFQSKQLMLTQVNWSCDCQFGEVGHIYLQCHRWRNSGFKYKLQIKSQMVHYLCWIKIELLLARSGLYGISLFIL